MLTFCSCSHVSHQIFTSLTPPHPPSPIQMFGEFFCGETEQTPEKKDQQLLTNVFPANFHDYLISPSRAHSLISFPHYATLWRCSLVLYPRIWILTKITRRKASDQKREAQPTKTVRRNLEQIETMQRIGENIKQTNKQKTSIIFRDLTWRCIQYIRTRYYIRRKKIKEEFLKKRKFSRMNGIHTEELFQREKIEEMKIQRGKNNKAYRKNEPGDSTIWPRAFHKWNKGNGSYKII